MFEWAIWAALLIGAAIVLLSPTNVECTDRTPATFIISTDPLVCDFTRGAGPLVR